MNAENFCYWVQGALELGRVDGLDSTQVQIIQDHLDLVFNKVTPVRPKTNEEILRGIADKFKDSPAKPFEFPQPYMGTPPFDLTTTITC